MAERLALAAAFLLPGIWWIWLVCAWLVYNAVGKVRKTNPLSWTQLAIGNLTAVLCGALSRHLLHF